MKSILTTKSLIWGGLIAYIVFNLLYIFRFNIILSQSQEVWGQYGDFIGGSLNPIFTIALIYLTFTIAKSNDKKIDESIEVQKRITLTQMRHERINDLIKSMNLNSNIGKGNQIENYWIIKHLELGIFCDTNIFLFEGLLTNEFNTNIQLLISDDLNALNNAENSKLYNSDPKKYQEILLTFLSKKSTFINLLNKFTIENI